MAKLQPVRGTRDIWGEDARRFRRVVETFSMIAGRYGFEEIATPIFEFTEVFKRTLGDATDIVSKEMYTFEDRNGDSLTLRPENTAGIARAYWSEGMQQFGTVKLYAHGPMFRYERPQKGRYRQFHQLDAEILGAPEPTADIELIAMGFHLLDALGLANDVVLHLNSLGDSDSRQAYRNALVDYFNDHRQQLSEDSVERLSRNPMRILDSKDEGDKKIVANAPEMDAYLNAESQDFFASVCEGLDILGLDYVLDKRLVRGLDYYCHTAFEFITTKLGAQGTVIGGGRYDGLMEQMGGPPTPGAGWAAGIERLAMLLDGPGERLRPVALIPLGEGAEKQALKLSDNLRRAGFPVHMAYRGNMSKRLKNATKAEARLAVIIGEEELSKGVAEVKDLDKGTQKTVPLDALLTTLTIDE